MCDAHETPPWYGLGAGRGRFRIPRAPRNVGPALLGHRPPVQEQVPRGIRTSPRPGHRTGFRAWAGSGKNERSGYIGIHSTLLNPIGAAILQSRVCEQAVRAGMSGSIQEIRRLQEILAELEVTTRSPAGSRPSGRVAFLSDAAEHFLEEFRAKYPQIEVVLQARGADHGVQRRAGSAVLVVLRESLVNAAQHAHPTRVEIDLAIEERSILLRVRDNGSGFDTRGGYTAAGPEGDLHWGRRLMREYADMAGGRIEFSSANGRGTQVTLYISPPPGSEFPQRLRPV